MGKLDSRWENIFVQAMEIADAKELAAFLDRVCSGDEPLPQEVEALRICPFSMAHRSNARIWSDKLCFQGVHPLPDQERFPSEIAENILKESAGSNDGLFGE